MTDFDEHRLGLILPIEILRGMPTSRTAKSGEVPVLSVAALRNGDAPRRFVGRREIEATGVEVAEIHDVLVSIEGGSVGECFVVHEGLGEFVPSQQVATIKLGSPPSPDAWYLGAWLSSAEGQQRMSALVRGSGIQRIAVSDLEMLEVKFPDDEEQRRIGERYRAFVESIRAHRTAVSCLEDLMDVELQIAFSEGGSKKNSPRREPVVSHPTGKPAQGNARRPTYRGGRIVSPTKKPQ